MRLSILVVSCNPSLLNGMLNSISQATKLGTHDVEILCSWNGEEKAEEEIENNSQYEFLITQRSPYHFATNMNQLAQKANGEILLFINDDIILDSNSIDHGINCLMQQSDHGIVAAQLRDQDENLVHTGIVFDRKNSPYHRLEGLVPFANKEYNELNEVIPASTGALTLIRRNTFLSILFNENYNVCGEDVELCLDIREKLGQKIVLCSDFSGIHFISTTRKEKNQFGNNSEDLCLMRQRRRKFLENISKKDLLAEINSNRKEIEILAKIHKDMITIQNNISKENDRDEKEIKQELEYWKNQAHTLQLKRIQMSEEIERLKKN